MKLWICNSDGRMIGFCDCKTHARVLVHMEGVATGRNSQGVANPARALLLKSCRHIYAVADFFWNYPANVPALTKLWKFGMDRVYRPFYFNLMIKDKGAMLVRTLRKPPSGNAHGRSGLSVLRRATRFFFEIFSPIMLQFAEAYKKSMSKLFGLDWDMIIPCHGVIVDQGAKQLLEKFIYKA